MIDVKREEKWNASARLFVETFQKVMGCPSDSLAGRRTFELLKKLDVDNKLTPEQWAEVVRRAQ